MGFLTNILAKTYTLSDLDRDMDMAIGGVPSMTGLHINEETALRFSAVFAAVKVLSETLAMLPIKIYRKRPGAGRDLALGHPLYELLHTKPNDDMTSYTFKEIMQSHLVTSGNNYAYKEMDGRGRVTKLIPINWQRIEPERDKETGQLFYKFRTDKGEVMPYTQNEIFHIPGLGFDGIKGYSPLRMAMEAVGIGLAAEKFGAAFYGNGINAGGVLEHPGSLTQEATDRLRKQFAEKHAGLGNSHKPILLEEGMKFNKITIPPNEAQFIETRRFQIEEIARIYRVPMHLLQDLSRSTNNNIEHQSLEFVMYTMMPWFRRWEEAINAQLLTGYERKQGYYAEFLVTALLRGDAKSRAEALNIMRQNGVINADEWRDLENMNPQEGNQGKKYLVNGNMIPVDMAGVKPQQGGGNNGQ